MNQAEANILFKETLEKFSQMFINGHVFANPELVVLNFRVSESLLEDGSARSFREFIMDAEQWVFDFWDHRLAKNQAMDVFWQFDV